MTDNKEINGSTVVIAGASSGFGRGAAVRLGELGANVVVAARRTAVLDEVVDEPAARIARVALEPSEEVVEVVAHALSWRRMTMSPTIDPGGPAVTTTMIGNHQPHIRLSTP